MSGQGGRAAAMARLEAGRKLGAIGKAGGRPAQRLRRLFARTELGSAAGDPASMSFISKRI